MNRAYCALTISLFVFLSYQGQEKINKKKVQGVEVVVNNLTPYKVNDKETVFELKKLFSIDTSEDKIFLVGLTGIETFDVDKEGNIYAIRWKSSDKYIYKFDQNGGFIKSFLRNGQGPGELEWGGTLFVDTMGRIVAKDPSKTKLIYYSKDGELINEVHLGGRIGIEEPLMNNGYLISWLEFKEKTVSDKVGTCDQYFGNIKVLSEQEAQNPMTSQKRVIGKYRFIRTASRDRIFIGFSGNGYEICEYDYEGRMVRKIKKKYTPVEILEEDKNTIFRNMRIGVNRAGYEFADNWPPYQYAFTDEEGRLFVMTFEKGKNQREIAYDIFDTEGIFIARTYLSNVGETMPLRVRAKNGRLYCLEENDDGYRRLVVYKTEWK